MFSHAILYYHLNGQSVKVQIDLNAIYRFHYVTSDTLHIVSISSQKRHPDNEYVLIVCGSLCSFNYTEYGLPNG